MKKLYKNEMALNNKSPIEEKEKKNSITFTKIMDIIWRIAYN